MNSILKPPESNEQKTDLHSRKLTSLPRKSRILMVFTRKKWKIFQPSYLCSEATGTTWWGPIWEGFPLSKSPFWSEVSVPGLTTAPQMKDLPRAGRPTSTSTTASHDTTCQDELRFRRGGGSDAVHLSLQKNSRLCWLLALHSLRRSRNQKEFLWRKK